MKLLSAVFLLVTLSFAHGYKILFMVPFNGPSHWVFLQQIIKELIYRGHEVTSITNQPIIGLKSSNYTEVLIDPPLDLRKIFTMEQVYETTYSSDFANIGRMHSISLVSSTYALNDSNVQKIIHSKNLHFDLVINEEFFQESWLMFGYKFNAPLITISTYGYSDFFDRAMGQLTPWSHVSHVLLSYTDKMSFSERFYNVFLSTYDWICRNWYDLTAQNALAKKYFGHLETERNGQRLPSVEELGRNISVILVNSHTSISAARPMMPGIINIGGAHIKQPKALPADIQKFLDESNHGVIYFSLGAFTQSSAMPKEKLSVFLNIFKGLKQNVIWKFEDESLTGVPSNVMIRKWLPQTDILAHKNIILFISHGGMFGNFEGIARGVPMLFIPLYGDQHRNALRAATSGYGRVLRFKDITHETLASNLAELTTNKSYYNRAKELSALFNDNLVHPLDETMFWIEYVCRHRGAKHLKSHAVNMSWFSYLILDIVFVTIGSVSAAIGAIYIGLKLIFGRKNKTSTNFKNKSKKRN